MKLSKKLYILFSTMSISMSSVSAATVFEDAFNKIISTFTNDIVISGLAVLFIYWGLYALFFWGTRFFSKEHGAQRVRVAISVVLSFFVGSFFILSLNTAGDKLGYVAAAWVMIFLLVAFFFVGIYRLYTAFFGKDAETSKAKNTTRITLFVLSLLIFLFIFSLVFTKVAWVVLSDGTGTFSLFDQGSLSGSNSVEGMLEDLEQEAQSQGGLAGGLIGTFASILNSIFGTIFAIAVVALIVFLGIIITRHKTQKTQRQENDPQIAKNTLRDVVKQIAMSLDDINAGFANKLELLKMMKSLKNQKSSNAVDTSSSSGLRADPNDYSGDSEYIRGLQERGE